MDGKLFGTWFIKKLQNEFLFFESLFLQNLHHAFAVIAPAVPVFRRIEFKHLSAQLLFPDLIHAVSETDFGIGDVRILFQCRNSFLYLRIQITADGILFYAAVGIVFECKEPGCHHIHETIILFHKIPLIVADDTHHRT